MSETAKARSSTHPTPKAEPAPKFAAPLRHKDTGFGACSILSAVRMNRNHTMNDFRHESDKDVFDVTID
jgi:hypothetical protein